MAAAAAISGRHSSRTYHHRASVFFAPPSSPAATTVNSPEFHHKSRASFPQPPRAHHHLRTGTAPATRAPPPSSHKNCNARADALTLTLHSCRKIQQPSLSLPLTEHSARVFVTNFPWFCSSTVFQLFSCSRDNSTSYRAAKTSVNPSSKYEKLGFPVLCCFNLFTGWLLIVRTVVDTVRLAQASLTRPSEMCRGSPRASCASGRSGDQGGRGLVWARLSRLSEIPQPERGAGRGSETFKVALQWSGRNSMAPVSGCSWWCPICITRRPEIHQGLTLWVEQRYPPQVQASAESDQVIRIRMSRVES
ncbi:hypothetical protein DEO72_LG2g3252 [Vigna unguiculata]|uniref:Uncharacterized protein n=1 Tax=Vigna unguiculata TaxID=3917 RepID=A0A4D6L364_VIGUN|nr:hypothetical protein DEO72_LG2g3252 [Vigna unguiculata]